MCYVAISKTQDGGHIFGVAMDKTQYVRWELGTYICGVVISKTEREVQMRRDNSSRFCKARKDRQTVSTLHKIADDFSSISG
jgi:hypothetical protein